MSDPVIYIENKSTVASPADLDYAVSACQKQIDQHFQPLWGWRADLVHGNISKYQMHVIMMDDSDSPGALGYHFKEGIPTTYVFAKTSLADSGEWTSVLSHELLEMIADPGANLGAFGQLRQFSGHRLDKGWVFFEVCDPVEAQIYEIDGIKVSNFVTPEWFESNHKKGSVPFDYLKTLSYPFQLAPAGYVDIEVAGHWRTVWGKKADQGRRRMRLNARDSYRPLSIR